MTSTKPHRRSAAEPDTRSGPAPAPPERRKFPIRVEIDREALAAFDKEALLAQVAIGLLAGWLASWVVGGSGLLRYAATGLIGSFVGTFVLDRLGLELGIRSPLLNRIATATLGAAAVVLAAKLLA